MIIRLDDVPRRPAEPLLEPADAETRVIAFPKAPAPDAQAHGTFEAIAGVLDLRLQLHAAVAELERARQALLASGHEQAVFLSEQLCFLTEKSAMVEHMIDHIEARLPAGCR